MNTPDKREASSPRQPVIRLAKSLRRLLLWEIFPSPVRTFNPVASLIQTFLITLLVLYVGGMLFALFFAHGMIFPAPPPDYTDSDAGVFKLPLPGGKTFSVMYFENPEATHTLLYSHGNGEDIGSNPDLWPWLRRMGFNVLVYDYPGYGTSGGRASEQGCYDAIESAYDYLIAEKGCAPEQIVLFGRSVGGGPTIDLAARKPVSGVILDGLLYQCVPGHDPGYASCPGTALTTSPKSTRSAVRCFRSTALPTGTVPFWHGQALYEKAAEPKSKLWVEGAGHNNLIETAGSDYREAIVNFRKSLSHE